MDRAAAASHASNMEYACLAPSMPRLFATVSFVAGALLRPSPARAEWVIGAATDLAVPLTSASDIAADQPFEVGFGLEGRAGYWVEVGPAALRAEAAFSYLQTSFPIIRALVGGRLEGTGLVSPFALVRAGWGWVNYHTAAPFSTQPQVLRSISGDGFAYEVGAGLLLRPPGPFEVDASFAYNALSEPTVEDAPYVDLRWFSAGVGAAVHF